MSQRRAPMRKRKAPARRRALASRAIPSNAIVPYQARVVAAPRQKQSMSNAFVKSATTGLGRAAGAGLAGLAGTAIGSLFGPAGAIAGKMLGALGSQLGSHVMDWVQGYGDYQVNENSLMKGGLDPPQIINVHENHGIIVRHREYLGDIQATTAFTNTTYAINPGVQSTFPWLAQIAGSYEEYRMRGLIFEFKSLSSDSILSSSTSSALGSVVMATQYNALNPAFTTKQEMENYEFANSSKPSCSFIHPVECDPKQTICDGKLYTRTGAVPSGSDQRLYDLGVFNIATVGMQAASGVCGELWCTYEVEFWKTKFNPITTGGEAGLMDHFQATAPTNANPFATMVRTSNSDLGGTISSNVYSFPYPLVQDGNYMFVYRVSGTGASITAPSITISGGTLLALIAGNSGGVTSSPQNGVTSQNYTLFGFVTVSNSFAATTITIGTGGTLPSAATTGDWYVMAIPSNIN